MLKSLELNSSTIVLAYGCPPEFFDFTPTDKYTKLSAMVAIFKDMQTYCQSKGADIIFTRFPGISDIPNWTNIEQFIAESYGISYQPNTYDEVIKQICLGMSVNYVDFIQKLKIGMNNQI